ncbi:MAG: nickel-dependent hydrogenase large subunit [Candidatus Aenigmarchaeota archaeon]|nr:nickel-dependent hydrogenase large subunit [Candidatus Aenigmarchaeota archaeon]
MTLEKKENSYSICVGPVHPALKEPVKLNMEIDGEKVIGVDFELSQVHRGIEWAATRRNPLQVLFLAERICGICNMCHMLSFSRAIETIGDIHAPPRAEYIRVIGAELERIHSHILWAGVAAHELGFDSLMHYTWKLRENVLDTIEYITGNRITKGLITIGGVRHDIPEKKIPRILESVNFYYSHFDKMAKVFLNDPVIKSRTRDVGILSRRDALTTCAVGPTARASGVKKDVRKDEAYAAYQDFDVEPILPDAYTGEIHGDVYDRVLVRLLEVKQSAEIIEKAVKSMPKGPIAWEEKPAVILAKLKPLVGEGIGRHEAPRGEVIHYVKLVGEESPYSWKVRAPTYNNMMPWVPMLMGEQIADIPIIAASIDPCMSCTNRAVSADKTTTMYTMDQLRRLSFLKTRELKRGLGK